MHRHRSQSSLEEVLSFFVEENVSLTTSYVDLEEAEPKIEQVPLVWKDAPISLTIVRQCQEELDRVSTDKKLNALRGLIQSITSEQTGDLPRICIFSMYNDTVSYLHSSTEEIGIPLFKITGSIVFSERKAIIDRFLKSGGLLIGTDGALSEGIDLAEVTDVVHYDMPFNRIIFEQRCGRFERYGRKTPCNVYFLLDDSGCMPLEAQLVEEVILDNQVEVISGRPDSMNLNGEPDESMLSRIK